MARVHLPFMLEGSLAKSLLPRSPSVLSATGFEITAKLSY